MAKLKVNPPKQPPMFRIEPFKGVDMSSTETQISQNNSPDMLNFNTDHHGALQKRTGYERVFPNSLGPGQINGIFEFDNNGKIEMIIAHGTRLYRLSDILEG